MTSPTVGVGLLTTWVRTRSDARTRTETESRLLPGTLSVWSSALMAARFRIVVPPVPVLTVADSASVATLPFARLPTVHRPVPAVYVPRLGVLEEYVKPAGRRSVSFTPVAGWGPLF